MKLLTRSRIALIALLLVLSTLFASCNFLSFTAPQETTTQASNEQTTPSQTESFDYSKVPAYSKDIYVTVNNNVPYFTQEEHIADSFENYANLDTLGRCGVAYACLGKDLMPTDKRGDISNIFPSGWVQASYDGIVDYLYNRSHLIGWQLAGENANEKNLITGTRSFNQLGMKPFEDMVADYIKETNNHVLYRVTPVYVGDELVARGVLMEAWSVEDIGDGICFCVFVYNVEPGIEIHYETGKSHLEGQKEEGAEGEENTQAPSGEPVDYIVNTSSKKFHLTTCYKAAEISDKNRAEMTATREEMIDNGYSPCGICKP